MSQKLTSLLTALHLILLGLFCFDFALSICSTYQFSEVINNYITLSLVLSGFILLLVTQKGEYLFYYYLFIYPIWFFGLVFFIIVSGGFSSHLTSKHYLAQKNEITITELKGFLAPCCTANVHERKFLVFQKSLGQVGLPCLIEESNEIIIEKKGNQVVIHCAGENNPELINIVDID